ncbi:MAG: site-specific integrase [Paludibacteraceae bacterium]|nr:site-specific integrase [Paludibacteraceae bacterium]
MKRKYNILPEQYGIRFRIRWNQNIVSLFIQYKVEKSKWSYETMRCKNNTFHYNISASEINREIAAYESTADEIFNRYELAGNIPDKFQLKNEMELALGKSKEDKCHNSMFELFDNFIDSESISSSWSAGTIKKFKSLRKHLENIVEHDMDINDIDVAFFNRATNYFIQGGYENSSTRKYIYYFKWFMRWARKNGYYNGKAIELFSAKLKGTDIHDAIVYLTWDELQMMYNTEMPSPYLDRARDVFCFCCFTSLRYSDVVKLQRQDVHDGYIEIVTQKTSDDLRIELNKYSKAILEKYKDCDFKNNKCLPVPTNQKMNVFIKEIGEYCCFDTPIKRVYYIGNKRHEETLMKYELLSTHAARRTFVVNALRLGIPAEVVMRWTGHKNYEAMKPYIAIVDEFKRSEMDKFNG